MNKPTILTIKFPDYESLQRFSSWLSDGGDSAFGECEDIMEPEKPITSFEFSKDVSVIVAKY